MSQLDFPRVNVRGLISINVGTANNDDYALQNVVPTYFKKTDEPKLASYDHLPMRLADTDHVQPTTFGQGDDEFRDWANSKVKTVSGGKVTKVLPAEWNYFGSMGMSMEFDYVDKDGKAGTSFTTVASVQTAPGVDVLADSDLSSLDDAVQSAVKPFLGARLSYKKRSEVRHSTAMLIDCSQEGSSQSSQVFADNLMLENPSVSENDGILLSRELDINGNYVGGGQPSKASTWWLNFQRNVNFGGPGGASGWFQTVVRFGDGVESAALEALFEACRQPGETRKLLGVVFRYSLFRVQSQYRADLDTTQEKTKKGEAIPGVGEMVGTLAPWYEGDAVEGLTLGRLLSPAMTTMFALMKEKDKDDAPQPGTFPKTCKASPNKPKECQGNGDAFRLAPAVVKLQSSDWLSLDFSTCVPEDYLKNANDPTSYDAYHDDTDPAITYNPKHDLGDLRLGLKTASGEATLAILTFDPVPPGQSATPPQASYGTQAYYDLGGMIDVPLTFEGYSRDDVAKGDLFVEWTNSSGGTERLLQESELMITSPTPTIYTEQAAGGSASRFNFNGDNVPCRLAIYRKGRPITEAEYQQMVRDGHGLVVQEFILNPLELQGTVNKYPVANVDVTSLDFELTTSVNSATTKIFVVARKGVPATDGGVIKTQSQIDTLVHPLIYARILPNEDFSQYFENADAKEPVGNDTLHFGVIYENVFRNYHLIYPAMSQQVPMNDPQQWAGPNMARKLLTRIDPSIWGEYQYMPRTRDLSQSRRQLIEAWCRRILKDAESSSARAEAAASADGADEDEVPMMRISR